MCLGIPGEVMDIYRESDIKMGKVKFGKILKEICLQFTPNVKVGDYVIVHAGFSLSILNKKEADKIFEVLK